jgi:cytoskeleton protein RodZ
VPVEPVGAYLRDMRERRGISLDEVSRRTRVPARYLEALEGDRFADLPAPVFVRGFVRAYCQALGELPDRALACLDAQGRTTPSAARVRAAGRSAGGPAAAPTERRSRTRGPALVSFVLLIVLGVALFSLTLAVHPRDERRAAEVAVEPPALDLEQASPGPAVAVEPEGASVPSASVVATSPAVSTGQAAPPPATPASAPAAAKAVAPAPPPPARTVSDAPPQYRLVARTTETTWLRVRTGDGRTTEETVPAGAVREWVSDRPFVLTIGNAGGVAFELNGEPLPSLGGSGTVIPRLVVPAESR